MSAGPRRHTIQLRRTLGQIPLVTLGVSALNIGPAKDVCEVLELKNPRNAAAILKEGETQHIPKSNVYTVDVSYPNRGLLCVNESGLYALIMKSRKAEAESFRVWVTSTVLPTIRKTGAYIRDEEKIGTGDYTRRKTPLLP